MPAGRVDGVDAPDSAADGNDCVARSFANLLADVPEAAISFILFSSANLSIPASGVGVVVVDLIATGDHDGDLSGSSPSPMRPIHHRTLRALRGT